MSEQQMLIFGGFVLTALLSLVAFFLKRLLNDHDKTKSRLDELNGRIEALKLGMEQNFVSFDTHQNMANRFTINFENIFKAQAAHGEILARLDERSRGEDRLAAVVAAIHQGFAQMNPRRR